METLSKKLFACIKEEKLVVMATIIGGSQTGNKMLIFPDGQVQGSMGNPELDQEVLEKVKQVFDTLEPRRESVESPLGIQDIFIDVFLPLPRLIIIGAVHIAIPLVHLAKTMGYHTIVVDARSVFASRDRFPHADELIVEWPSDALQKLNINESTSIVTLTHDEKFDVPVLQVALSSRARYVGALGSKKTHANRVESLRERGLTDEQIFRIHAPIGLGLGAKTPEEIALSIMAEIVAVRRNKILVNKI